MKRIKLEYGSMDSLAHKGYWPMIKYVRYKAYIGMYRGSKIIFKEHYIISNVIKWINPAR